MDFFSAQGYLIYGLTTLFAVMTGCIPILILAGAAAFGAPSQLWLATYFSASIIWILVSFSPLVFIVSRSKILTCLALLGSSAAIIYCVYAVAVLAHDRNKAPLIVGFLSAPLWLWLLLPLGSNALQLTFTLLRRQQADSLRNCINTDGELR